jgi:hypothetical protein
MWKLFSCSRVATLAAVGLAACQADPSATANDRGESSTPRTSPEVSSLEAELAAAQDDLSATVDEAKACFAEFRSCKEAGSTDCGEALKACLPGPTSTRVDCAPAPTGSGSRGRGLLGRLRGKADAGAGLPGLIGGFGSPSGAQPECGDLPPVAGPLAACKDSAGASIGQLDPATIGDAFQACIGDAFDGVFADICERITVKCDAATLPAEPCDRLAELCSDAATAP